MPLFPPDDPRLRQYRNSQKTPKRALGNLGWFLFEMIASFLHLLLLVTGLIALLRLITWLLDV
ncbi:hypothetical protein KOR42_45140 [Thalassoglobus neptunius]|uniref:Uncharacterized protein n=1 Tax=Thalassoglobus neptunius TaxID=1938619 RepID=A0A5C5VX43_9PLAN|nr:hypothetical protein [Thalassoglobus neptunius]TWT43054.1 hypothetical protein KOR42_45140 [Thalassoglobus neptunius]